MAYSAPLNAGCFLGEFLALFLQFPGVFAVSEKFGS